MQGCEANVALLGRWFILCELQKIRCFFPWFIDVCAHAAVLCCLLMLCWRFGIEEDKDQTKYRFVHL